MSELNDSDEDDKVTEMRESRRLMSSLSSFDEEDLHAIPSENEDLDQVDILSRVVKERSGGCALYSVIGICISMVAVSFALIYQFGKHLNRDDLRNTSTMPALYPEEICAEMANAPLWQQLLEQQIDVIQNLVHASLLGGAAFVAAIRGDAMWLFFCRNTAFFFAPIALAYLIHDIHACAWLGHNVSDYSIRIALSLCLLTFASSAFVRHETTRVQVRRLTQWDSRGRTHVNLLPDGLADTELTIWKANIIYYCAILVQFSSLLYVLVTTLQSMTHNAAPSHGTRSLEESKDTMPDENGTLKVFEMTYSMGAHQALLLSLLMLGSTFPKHFASIGGALLTSSWRLIVAVTSIIFISSRWTGSLRDHYSLLYLSLEIMAMVPICLVSITLVRQLTTQQTSVPYTRLGQGIEEDEDSNHPIVKHAVTAKNMIRYYCPSLNQIAASPKFSSRQRIGAAFLSCGSILLLGELTAECVILLRQHVLRTGAAHEIYKWGMHICSIFIFCFVMAVETPFIYRYCRCLLSVACPAGCFIAIWELLILNSYRTENTPDWYGSLVMILFGIRAVCGALQCMGLFLLHHIEPECVDNTETDKGDYMKMCICRRKAQTALYSMMVPSFALYVITIALSTCSEPLISPNIPNESTSGNSMFILAQNWPGLGLFFHFGMLTIIFASDGLSIQKPSYPPSLGIASLFSAHVAFLVFIDFMWDASQTKYWMELSVGGLLARLSLALWMATSLYLAICLRQLQRLRVITI